METQTVQVNSLSVWNYPNAKFSISTVGQNVVSPLQNSGLFNLPNIECKFCVF